MNYMRTGQYEAGNECYPDAHNHSSARCHGASHVKGVEALNAESMQAFTLAIASFASARQLRRSVRKTGLILSH